MVLLRLLFVLCAVGLPAADLVAQSTNGTIRGVVRDRNGRGLIGAAVQVVDQTAVTDRDGRFTLSQVPAGSREVRARFIGYAPATVTATIVAGGSVDLPITLTETAYQLPEVGVDGARFGQALALNQQQNADNIRNVVDAELVGRLPDPNTADALQRLPGVSIQRDQGEGRYVQVRGTSPRLSNVTLNGVRVPASDGDVRQVALDVIPSDQLAAIELSKTLTPDQDAEAIGGSINLVQRAPRSGALVAQATAAGGYNALVRDGIGQFSGTLGKRWGKVGAVLGGTFYKTNRGSNNIEGPGAWTQLDGGEDFLEELEFRDYLVNRQRWGLNGVLEYDASKSTSLFVRGIYNDFSDFEFRRTVAHAFADGDVTPTGAGSFDLDGFTVARTLRERFEVQRLYSVQVGGVTQRGGTKFDYTLALSRGSEVEPTANSVEFEAEEAFSGTLNLRDSRNPRIAYASGSADPADPSNFEFNELGTGNNRTRDLDRSAQANLEIPLAIKGGAGSIKLGGLARFKKKNRINDEPVYGDFNNGDLTLADVEGSYANNRFYFGRYRFGPSPDPAGVRGLIGSNAATNFELDENDTREADAANYDAAEDVYAGYAMLRLSLGRLLLLPGARVEATRYRFTGNSVEYDADGDFVATTPVQGRGNYTNIFPGVNARYALTENTNLRGAVTTSLARPNYFDLVPYTLAFREDEEVEFGNANLRPTRAINVDLLAEHYLKSVGVLSAGVFYKRLTDFIYPRTFTVTGGTFDGFTALQSQNGDAATIWGAEFGIQQNFTKLPGLLGGLGVNANYTYTRSRATFPDRGETSRLPGQASHIGNVALSFERGRLQARLAANYFGDYIDEVGDEADDDRYFDSQLQVDASASFRVTPTVRLFAEGVNLTDQPLRYYQGRANRPDQQEYYSRWGLFGFRVGL